MWDERLALDCNVAADVFAAIGCIVVILNFSLEEIDTIEGEQTIIEIHS